MSRAVASLSLLKRPALSSMALQSVKRGGSASVLLQSATTIVPRRDIGTGYTGEREAGYDQAAMDNLRSMGDQPFFMLNILKIVDMEAWTEYYTKVDEKFKEIGAENVYSGLLRDAPVPVSAAGSVGFRARAGGRMAICRELASGWPRWSYTTTLR